MSFIALLPIVFSMPQAMPVITNLAASNEHVSYSYSVCPQCDVAQDDESELVVPNLSVFNTIKNSQFILLTLADGQRAWYKQDQPSINGWIVDDLPDVWIKNFNQELSETLHYHVYDEEDK